MIISAISPRPCLQASACSAFVHPGDQTYVPDRVRFLFFSLGDRRVASSRVRAYWVCGALERLGAACRVFPRPALRRFLSAIRATFQSDIVVFQKRFTLRHHLLAHIARFLGKRIDFDIDDAPSRDASAVVHPGAITTAKLVDGVSCLLAGDRIGWGYALLGVETCLSVGSEMGGEGCRVVQEEYAVGLPSVAILEAVTPSSNVAAYA